MDEGVDRLKN